MKHTYYWDNSATTQASAGTVEAVVRMLTADYGNPSSLHRKGIEAERVLKEARQIVARSLKAKEKEITFTSGGTEANNLALTGLYAGHCRKGKHIVSTQIEHPAVLKTLEHLQTLGAEVTLVKPSVTGRVEVEAILDAVRPDTILVSAMMVNNETGIQMESVKLGRALKALRSDILFHTDAVQAYGKMPISMIELKADALSLSGHKFHGPKGTGALYVREGVKCQPILFGGGQESGLRPGTENMPGIAGLAAAVKEADGTAFLEKTNAIKSRFLLGLEARGINYAVNGAQELTVPYIVNLSFPGLLSEVLLHALESKGIYVSAGSACSSKKKVYSGVLQAMDIPDTQLESALRFSFSSLNENDNLEAGLDLLADTIREISQIMNRRDTWKR